MEDSAHFEDRRPIEDDYELLFGPIGRHGAVESGELARIWRVYIAEDGYEGVSSAMTLDGAREFAVTMREDGIAVLRIESVEGQVVEGDEMFGRGPGIGLRA